MFVKKHLCVCIKNKIPTLLKNYSVNWCPNVYKKDNVNNKSWRDTSSIRNLAYVKFVIFYIMNKAKYNFTILCWSDNTDFTFYISTHHRSSFIFFISALCHHQLYLKQKTVKRWNMYTFQFYFNFILHVDSRYNYSWRNVIFNDVFSRRPTWHSNFILIII